MSSIVVVVIVQNREYFIEITLPGTTLTVDLVATESENPIHIIMGRKTVLINSPAKEKQKN